MDFPLNASDWIGRFFARELRTRTLVSSSGAMEREVRRKRRPASACPNPLFVKWVEEWRDQAREEGSKVQYAYTKVELLARTICFWHTVMRVTGSELAQEVSPASSEWSGSQDLGSHWYIHSHADVHNSLTVHDTMSGQKFKCSP